MQDFDRSPAFQPISKVIVWYDEENAYQAGNDTGRTLEIDCPWATQQIANDILTKVNGAVYYPYSASDALLDVSADVGDTVTANGVYSLIATLETNYDGLNASNISAPQDEEIDHEYPYLSKQQREANRAVKLGQYYYGTKITRAEGITIEKTNGSDVQAKAVFNADELSFYAGGSKVLYFDPASSTYRFEGVLNVADNFIVDANGNVTINGNLAIPSGAIGFEELDTNTQDSINAINDVTTYLNGKTYIDGSTIATGSIYASSIHLGGDLIVYTTESGSVSGGYLGYTTSALDGSAGIHLQSGSGEVVATNNGSKLLYGYSNEISISTNTANVQLSGSNYEFSSSYFASYRHSTLGTAGVKWGQIYSENSTISTSDANAKHDINPLPQKYVDMLMLIEPKIYKYNDGTSDRYHVGYIAQDVEKAMNAACIPSIDFGGFVTDYDEEGNKLYMLRYEEFIAIHTKLLQDIAKKVGLYA